MLRAAQFHEFVAQLMEWGARGEVTYVPRMRTQLVAARTVAEALADLATTSNGAASAARRSSRSPARARSAWSRWRRCSRPAAATRRASRAPATRPTPASAVYESGGLLPGPDAILAGPTFEEWLDEAA